MTSHTAPLEVLEHCVRGLGMGAGDAGRLVRDWISGGVTDPQMAAWLALARERGVDREVARAVTSELLASGDRLELSTLAPVGGLESTGAVGDNAVLVAAPLAAALGVRVLVTADPAAGVVGGLLEKLAAIPGYRLELTFRELVTGVRDTGCVAVHPGRLAPAERRLTALRDETATSDGADMLAACLMARALAAGAGALCVETVFGTAAHLVDEDQARHATALMASLAEPWGRPLRTVLVRGDRVLGRAVGHAPEVAEAGTVLRGEGPADLRAVAARLAGELAEAAGVAAAGEGTERARRALADGTALAAAERWVESQGGDPGVWSGDALGIAPARYEVTAPAAGYVTDLPARTVGEVVRRLGAGRMHPSQTLDHAVGVEILAVAGEQVDRDEPVLLVRSRDAWLGEVARDALQDALTVGPAPPAEVPALVDGDDGA